MLRLEHHKSPEFFQHEVIAIGKRYHASAMFETRSDWDLSIRLDLGVRDVFAYMREHVDTEIAAAHIVIDGSSVVLCDGDNLIDVLRHGHGMLNVLPLSAVKDEVDRNIIDLEEHKSALARSAAGQDIRKSAEQGDTGGGISSVI